MARTSVRKVAQPPPSLPLTAELLGLRTSMPLGRRLVLLLTLSSMISLLYLAFVWAPSVANFDSKIAQRIFYFHVPAALVAYLAFGITFAASLAYLARRSPAADLVAGASAEIGVVFGTIAVVTGPLWAKEEWSVYWRWEDTKLTLTFVLWLFYLAYLALRTGVRVQEDEARLSAVMGVLGFALVPLSYSANLFWPSLHPRPIANPSGGGLDGQVLLTLLLGIVTFTLLYVTFLLHRLDLRRLEILVEDLKDEVERGRWKATAG